MNLVQFLNLASGTAANGANAGKSQISLIVMMVLLFGVMYFVMIRPQKKKQKEEQQMRDSIEVGDEITTIGGLTGKIVQVTDDTITFETGEDRVRIGHGPVIAHGVDAAQNDQQHQRQCQHGGGNEFFAQPLDHGFFSSEYPAFRVALI